MAVTKVTYASDEAIVTTNWEGLATNDWATLPLVTNVVNLYVDVLIGGQVDLSTVTGGPVVAGESFDISVAGRFDTGVATSWSGGIDTALTDNDSSLTEDTEFTPLNLKLLTSVAVEATAPDVEQGYNWGPESVAGAFGGVMPQQWMLVGHNNTAASTKTSTSTFIVNLVGITYTTA